ncbi:hypothetical protein AWM75_05640 [Aerococcus urinaehominis]|uniref:Uncharacterized protein n=1 Tax=Aerococcus urinaehominis TaxID=128944 RepID=A0A0X8FLI5_9LACT|nr:C40 family peptidase [Aerococcus urinaehominis]AMB99509.1 hypothetical protein AWM75_05640 [Aerococcus urinaehominis]SDM25969.1 Cell wall-associated hydrolase, NlpC family [Aerococcus urinaehominis]
MSFSVKSMLGTSLATTAALVAIAPSVVADDYTIQWGDTLTDLAQKHNVTLDDLKAANGITDSGDLIIAGHTLVIPELPQVVGQSQATDGQNVYTVQAGDTLNKIAAQFGTTADSLRALNNIQGDLIFIGQQLVVAGQVAEAATVAPVVEEPAVAEETTVEAEPAVVETDKLDEAELAQAVAYQAEEVAPIAEELVAPASEAVGEQEVAATSSNEVESTEATVTEEVAPKAEAKEETPVATAETAAAAPASAEATAVDAEVAPAVQAAPAPAQETVTVTEAETAPIEEAAPVAQPVAYEAPAVEAPAPVKEEAPAETAPVEEEVVAEPVQEAAPAAETQHNGSSVLEVADQYVGTPYVWGGRQPGGFDCSGFVQYVYREAEGREVGSWTGEQQYAGPQIAVESAQQGDLLFWGDYGNPYHVAISTGDNGYIHSPQPGQTVGYGTVSEYWYPSFAVQM